MSLDTISVAARLLGTVVFFLIVPGLALLRALRVSLEWPERIVFAFALSYCWFFVMAAILPLAHLTIDHAIAATIVLPLAVCVVPAVTRPQVARLPEKRAEADGDGMMWLAVVLVAACVVGWYLEPPFTGEEALDFASITRFADGGRITLNNTSLLPDTPPIYVVQP